MAFRQADSVAIQYEQKHFQKFYGPKKSSRYFSKVERSKLGIFANETIDIILEQSRGGS